MKNLLSQIDFGNEAGDDVSPQEILNFFVEQQHFSDYLDPDQKILLATAKKGIGKSALMRWIEARKSAEDQNTPLVISITAATWFGQTSTYHQSQNFRMNIFVTGCSESARS